MRVLEVMEATEGGTRRHLRDLVAALNPAEFEIGLAVSCRRDSFFRTDLEAYAARGIGVTLLPMTRGIAPVVDGISLLGLIRCIRRTRPALIHAHSAKAGFLARLAGPVCGVPVVYTPHAFPFLMTCGTMRRRMYRALERSVVNATAALIAVSEEERRAALALGYETARVHLIPNGVPPCDAGPVTVREGEALCVGFFGRLVPQKGPDVLLEAASDVTAHLPQTVFALHGSGPLAKTLRVRAGKKGLSGHVRFDGPYAQDEAVALMRQADVVALPSRWEGFPYVALEALQAGVPVVASAAGGLSDLIRHGVNGLCVESGNPEALCDALLDLLRHPRKRARLAEEGRASVAARSVSAMADAVGGVYRTVCAGPCGK